MKLLFSLFAACLAFAASAQQSTIGTRGYWLLMPEAGSFGPSGSQTYFFGSDPAMSTTLAIDYTNAMVRIPQSGTIKAFDVFIHTGTAGSAEDTQFFLRLNNATDFAQIHTTCNWTSRSTNVTGLAQLVSAGDTIAVKMVTPAWGTPPLTCRFAFWVYIE